VVFREGGNWVQEITGNLGRGQRLCASKSTWDRYESKAARNRESVTLFIIALIPLPSSRPAANLSLTRSVPTTKGDTAWIVGDWQGWSKPEVLGDFVINVPRNLEFAKIETDGGSVRIAAISGRAEIQSGGGSIRLDDIGGTIDAETGGGIIEVGTVGSDVNVRTGGGQYQDCIGQRKLNAEAAVAAFRLSLHAGSEQWRLALATSRWNVVRARFEPQPAAQRGSRRYRRAP